MNDLTMMYVVWYWYTFHNGTGIDVGTYILVCQPEAHACNALYNVSSPVIIGDNHVIFIFFKLYFSGFKPN